MREVEFALDDDEYYGTVDEIHTEYWVIDGLRFELCRNRRLKGHQSQRLCRGEFVRNASGENYLLEVEFADSEIIGVVEKSTDYWIVNGIRFEVLPNSKIEKGIKVGDFVEVEFGRNQAGEYILLEVEFDDSEIYGVVDEIHTDYWIVNGIRFKCGQIRRLKRASKSATLLRWSLGAIRLANTSCWRLNTKMITTVLMLATAMAITAAMVMKWLALWTKSIPIIG